MDEKTKSALRQYVVFRIKAIEFLDLNAVRQSLLDKTLQAVPLPNFPPLRPPRFVADSIRTVSLSWLGLFIDKNGMNVLHLWKELFPQHKTRVEEAWKIMAPAWPILVEFRNRAGFHADKPRKFFDARRKLRQSDKVEPALLEFEKLFRFFLGAEAKELPMLEAALDSMLDEFEKEHGAKYQRQQFKAYLMIPDTEQPLP